MRVARVVTRLNRGGPARTLLAVEPLLRRLGVESLLLTGSTGPGEDDLTPQFERAGIAVRRIPGLRRPLAPCADWEARHHVERAFADFRPDVIHTHTSKAGLIGRLSRAPGTVRRVHTFHGHVLDGNFARLSSRLLVALERWLARRTDLLLAVSERVRTDLCDRFRIAPRSRTEVLPGVLLPEMVPAADATERAAARRALRHATGTTDARFDDARWIGTLARLTAVKAPGFFLDVAERLRAECPSCRFVWIGDGDLRTEFLADVHRRGLAPFVHWIGWQEQARPWHLALDVEVLLSDQEGLPLSLMEAKALQVPVVATAVGGVPDLVRDGLDGTLVGRRDAEAAARALAALLDPSLQSIHPEGPEPAAGGAADRVSAPRIQGLAPEEHARRLVAFYERLLAAPPRAA